jgi:hypothetical protein
MLILLKNQQHKIASVTLSLFMGSWLLLFCQTCVAAFDQIESQNETKTVLSDFCHAPDIDNTNEIAVENDAHCYGVCDCDEMTTTVTVKGDSNHENQQKIKYLSDLYASVNSQLTLHHHSPPTYRISTLPEQAIFLPQQFYTVLLI